MRTSTIALILLSVTLSAFAQVSFKIGMSGATSHAGATPSSSIAETVLELANAGVLIGLALYGIGTLLWLQVLARTDLSQAYPFVGAGFVMTAAFGVVLFGEAVTMMRAGGIALVILGIFLIARS